ncbi:Permease of the drug/metabolite transporter (DMT) superfamily [Bacillus amyloliquefaciens]|nr:hypothetical protein U471_37920 [Bacillus amyloliquefaciens CC178]QEY89820.1 Permease of the drug/metabolite transporter (DMT) superfamily [Bacillus amyloliquefaciens]QEY95450.1 Permease of the drug/metabolite transporter (DMT) superfamily [Bacillus amyloliquefaciens]
MRKDRRFSKNRVKSSSESSKMAVSICLNKQPMIWRKQINAS